MTTSKHSSTPNSAFVWVWLPGAVEPVVAGRLTDRGAQVTFTYGRSYLDRSGSIALYLPELPLDRGEQVPRSGNIAGCIADAAPDAWGRRVIEHRRAAQDTDLGTLAYLLGAGSDRIGAIDVQPSASTHVPRESGDVSLHELARATDQVERGEPLSPGLDLALIHGSSVGGARPKALMVDGHRRWIAKFSSTTDTSPVVKAEFVAMKLAHLVGLEVAPVRLDRALGKDVLLVERFDRPAGGTRRIMVSALTILELHDADGVAGRYATYPDLATNIRARFTEPRATLRELFSRITFNILVGNTDDHARNHAAFWDGNELTLTPAYDICPQGRTGQEAAQAMAFGPDGERMSQVARCVAHASTYHLSGVEAREIIDHQVETITANWTAVCDRAELSSLDRARLWGRQFLNPYALYDYPAS